MFLYFSSLTNFQVVAIRALHRLPTCEDPNSSNLPPGSTHTWSVHFPGGGGGVCQRLGPAPVRPLLSSPAGDSYLVPVSQVVSKPQAILSKRWPPPIFSTAIPRRSLPFGGGRCPRPGFFLTWKAPLEGGGPGAQHSLGVPGRRYFQAISPNFFYPFKAFLQHFKALQDAIFQGGARAVEASNQCY
eukprot:EG_transcript_18047